VLVFIMTLVLPGALSGFFGASPQQSSYEDIDRNVPQTSQGGAYDFANAQQI
jgi:hypothetical protein